MGYKSIFTRGFTASVAPNDGLDDRHCRYYAPAVSQETLALYEMVTSPRFGARAVTVHLLDP